MLLEFQICAWDSRHDPSIRLGKVVLCNQINENFKKLNKIKQLEMWKRDERINYHHFESGGMEL